MPLLIPNTLSNGKPAVGTTVEENFQAVKTFVDALETDLDAAEAAIPASNPSVVLERTSDVVVAAASNYDVTWETETLNGLSSWWSSGWTITVPTTGLYAVSIECKTNYSSGGTTVGWTDGYGMILFDGATDLEIITDSPSGVVHEQTYLLDTTRSWGEVVWLIAGQTMGCKLINTTPDTAMDLTNSKITFVKLDY